LETQSSNRGLVVKKRPLGNSGIDVAPLALGGNVFGWTVGEAESFPILDAFVEAGFDLIDTADVYSRWAEGNKGGESETIIGRWLAKSGARKKVVIATKCGLEMGPNEQGLSRDYIFKAVERSLNRLQIDVVDLYQAHRDDESTPLDETLGAFAELIKLGKVRAIGASNYSAQRLAKALEVSRKLGLPRFETLQPEFNLYDRAGYEAELEPLCRSENLGVIPYYSLASGFLTGKYRTEADLQKSPRGAKAKNYLNDRGRRILAALDAVAARYKITPGKAAIAWLRARPSITAPIASATSVEQLHDLIEAAKLELDADAILKLDKASAV
jgi:aryl-alcohol dehydrogenase-like predicted oxidoreductase